MRILTLLLLFSSISLVCAQNANGKDTLDNHLRAQIILQDTLKFDSKCNDCILEGVFKFKVKRIFCEHKYTAEYIYVKTGISQNNIWFSKDGFYWVLFKTEERINEIPVYRHSGNF